MHLSIISWSTVPNTPSTAPSGPSSQIVLDLACSLPAPRPIFEAEFLASFYGIGKYRPISNNIHLIGDNLGVLFCLKRGSSRNLFANEILKSLAHFWLNSPFFLNICI